MQIQKLKTVDADTLLSTPIRKTLFVVDGLIPQGLSVLSGPSKIGKSGMYANDYDDIAAVKDVADRFGIALILVHHTRKQEDKNDPFNQVSGSTGITGAADTSFVLKHSRTSELGTLLATRRNIEYQELTLQFSKERHVWELVERKDMEDIRREEIPPFLFRVVEFMQNKAEWIGTATELLNLMQEKDTPSNTVTKLLGRFAGDVLTPAGIEYQTKRTGQSRLIRFQNMTAMTPVTAETTDMESAVTAVTTITNSKNAYEKENENHG